MSTFGCATILRASRIARPWRMTRAERRGGAPMPRHVGPSRNIETFSTLDRGFFLWSARS